MAHGDNSEGSGAWRAGSLSIDELERLAGAIRPSWEIGLDAAHDAAVEVALTSAIAPSAQGFTAAPAALQVDLAGMAAAASPSAPVVRTASAPPRALSQPAPPVNNAPSARPMPARAVEIDDAIAPSSRRKLPLAGILAGVGVVLVAALVLAFRGGSDSTPSTDTAAPSSSLASTAASSAANPPAEPPAVVPAPEPTVAPRVDPAPVPAPTRAENHAHASPTPAASPAPRRAASPAPAHAARRPRGVGFVTDSPY